MPHAGIVQPHIAISIMDKQYVHSLQDGLVEWTDKCSFMHFWLVTVKKRKRSNAGEQKEEEEEKGGQRGQWESGSQYSTCISLSARAALSYSAAKERNNGMKKKMKRKWKTPGHQGG